MSRVFWSLVSLFLSLGCSGVPLLKVQLLGAGTQKPSNVAMYFQIDKRFSGEPVTGLTESNFEIYEDGRPISRLESTQILLNPQAGAVHHTMLLLDLSGSVTKAGQMQTLIKVASAFVDRVSQFQLVGLYGFDGSEKIQQLNRFTNDPKELRAKLEKLADHQTKDPSTNLHGAVVKAIQELERQRDSAITEKIRLSFGTLVVFTDGTDQAKRVTKKQLKEAVKNTNLTIFVVGLGGEIDPGVLKMIGQGEFFFAEDEEELSTAFDGVGKRIEGLSKRYYLFSYCSPARSGGHKLKVKIRHGKLKGTKSINFNADGFTPNCNPQEIPELEPPAKKKER